jgi:hypothetical protein
MLKYLSDQRLWLVVALNLLNGVLIWVLHNWSLALLGQFVLTMFALCNAALGTWLLYKVVKKPLKRDAD